MRSVSSPPTVGSTTISNSLVITSMPTTIARLAMPPSARGTMWPKLRLQPDSGAAGFSHRASATGNLTLPVKEGRKPATEHINVLVFAQQAGLKGETGAELIRSFGDASYDSWRDQLVWKRAR